MKGMFIPSPEQQQQALSAMALLTDTTDAPCVVRLVEGEFDAADPTTWPVPSTHFASKTSGVPTLEFDATSGKWYIVWIDPVGGWDYVAATITDTITITGFTVKNAAGDAIGAGKIAGVAVVADGQHVVLPFMAMELVTKPLPIPTLPISI